jgi:hypothetical protein
MNKEKTAGGRREPIVFTIGLDDLMKTQLQETQVSTGNQESKVGRPLFWSAGPLLSGLPNC